MLGVYIGRGLPFSGVPLGHILQKDNAVWCLWDIRKDNLLKLVWNINGDNAYGGPECPLKPAVYMGLRW